VSEESLRVVAVPGSGLEVKGKCSPFRKSLRPKGTGNRCDLQRGGGRVYITGRP
jgi:hypothetical protein